MRPTIVLNRFRKSWPHARFDVHEPLLKQSNPDLEMLMKLDEVEIDLVRLEPIVDEFKQTICARFPETQFEQYIGEDPDGLYLAAIVDIDDPDEAIDLIIDRLVDVQTEEMLPLHVVAVHNRVRSEAAIRDKQRKLSTYSVLDDVV